MVLTRSVSVPCRLPSKLRTSGRSLCQFELTLAAQQRPAFCQSSGRRKQSQGILEHLQSRAFSQSGTGLVKELLSAASAGTGAIRNSAEPVTSEKGPGRGRRFLPAVPAPRKHESAPGAMRVYLISDIHTDHEENLDWIRDLSPTSFLNDALIVAGDISDDVSIFEETFRILRPKFAHVFFTPGNHDLWLRSNKAPVSQPAAESVAKPETKAGSETNPENNSTPRTGDGVDFKPEGNSETASANASEPSPRDLSRTVSDTARATEAVSGRSPEPASGAVLGVDASAPPENSLSKLAVLFKICQDLGIDTRPKFLKPEEKSGQTRKGGSASENCGEASKEKVLQEPALGRGPVNGGVSGQQAIVNSQRKEPGGCGSTGLSERADIDAGISASVDNLKSVASTHSQVDEQERNPEAGIPERVANCAEPVEGNVRPSLTGRREPQRSAPGAGSNGACAETEGRTTEARVAEPLSSVDERLTSAEEWVSSQTGGFGEGGIGRRETENGIRWGENQTRTEENGARADACGTRGGGAGTSEEKSRSRGGESGTQGGGDGPGGSVSKGSSGRDSGVAEEEHGVWVVPILSWHHISFDTEPDIPGYNIPPIEKVAKDHKVCKWPAGWDARTESVARAFDEMNHELHRGFDPTSNPGCHVITFSHFLPRLELIPEKRFLFYPNLAKAVGSHALEARVRAIHAAGAPGCHLFGHTHFSWDMTLDGVRYIQAPLAYPRERKRRMNGGDDWLPLCVYDSSRGGVLTSENRCDWSDYYKTHARDPDNFEFAPWVANLWRPIRKKPESAGET
ncbi:hypothetical protein KFL_002940030 [Klebsormidium nitens]|uniref:Calcineurin-like phosphoesterase domain-containing protein n=1 Tax=Klebsormidium nitens TaxID=105231 RepID=A0A1Y1ICR7_KLENI|nr:hypothetical protein KFL_002940030 [Klebsormidium nitens]|eukprot:GAQ86517.1 hypothetical protein KFL_002940030 [Klebsormidium nitens]